VTTADFDRVDREDDPTGLEVPGAVEDLRPSTTTRVRVVHPMSSDVGGVLGRRGGLLSDRARVDPTGSGEGEDQVQEAAPSLVPCS